DKVSPAWGLETRNALATYVSQVAQLSEGDRRPTRCIAAPTVWVALAALCVCEQSHVEMINSSGDGRESRRGESDGRPLCSNHDDGSTAAVIECRTCGPLCAECDRFLHLNRAARTHHRQICKEEESAIRIDIHEGCGRAKLFWLLLLVDRRTFKGLAEFRGMESGVCDNGAGEGSAILPGPPGLAGTCRFCGTRGNSGLLAIGNVCADQQCQDHGKEACSRVLPCNHLCGGVRSERTCLPCLFGCAGAPDAVPLRQDADDMCMICFTDPLQAAPAIQNNLLSRRNTIPRKAIVRLDTLTGKRQGEEGEPKVTPSTPGNVAETTHWTKPTPKHNSKLDSTSQPEPLNTTYAILFMYKHSGYRDVSVGENIQVQNDIAMLNTEPITLQEYGKVASPDFYSLIGYEARIVDYGINESKRDAGRDPPRSLQSLDVLIVECPQDHIMYPAICVASRCTSLRSVLCKGDAGGSLISYFGVIGIIGRNTNGHCLKSNASSMTSLKCGHVFHLHCCKKVLVNKWIGPRITFSFSQCPICKENMNHWTLEELLAPIRQLYDEVKRKALMRLEYEGCALPGQAKGKVLPDPATYAMERYAYYVCHKCGKAYFGGLARCEAETSGWWEPNELVCGACSDVAGARTCPKHGADFLEYKCRYCCSVAVFFCFGTSHFCNACHDDFQRVTSIPKHLLPQCPAGPKGEQLPGSSDECPLHVQHPPTGEEFALGCGVCRHAQGF
ncbi:hypothetical protein HW555_004272, partial [Spodoptera exigua]